MDALIRYFERPGPENTDAVLELVNKRALERGVTHVVVASNTGNTGLKAAEVFKGTNVKVVVVTLQAGTRGLPELSEENRRRLEELGVKIVRGTHAFGGVGMSTARWPPPPQPGTPPPSPPIMPPYIPPIGELIARVLRLFGSGFKVCLEITVMAADAGVIPVDRDVIAVAGTHKGADTALLLKPAYSTNFFDIDVKEIIAKPYSRPVERF
ncbi:MAG: pyruvate kinase alpha/beta domain-containing protein [Candidatus Bathyarchaeia archaeon]